jgi:hypothetical protein
MADRERFSVYDHSTGNRTCYNADGTIDFLHEPPRLKYGEFTMPDDTAVLPHPQPTDATPPDTKERPK